MNLENCMEKRRSLSPFVRKRRDRVNGDGPRKKNEAGFFFVCACVRYIDFFFLHYATDN